MLPILGALPNLKELVVTGVPLFPSFLNHILSLPHLTTLTLSWHWETWEDPDTSAPIALWTAPEDPSSLQLPSVLHFTLRARVFIPAYHFLIPLFGPTLHSLHISQAMGRSNEFGHLLLHLPNLIRVRFHGLQDSFVVDFINRHPGLQEVNVSGLWLPTPWPLCVELALGVSGLNLSGDAYSPTLKKFMEKRWGSCKVSEFGFCRMPLEQGGIHQRTVTEIGFSLPSHDRDWEDEPSFLEDLFTSFPALESVACYMGSVQPIDFAHSRVGENSLARFSSLGPCLFRVVSTDCPR